MATMTVANAHEDSLQASPEERARGANSGTWIVERVSFVSRYERPPFANRSGPPIGAVEVVTAVALAAIAVAQVVAIFGSP